MNFVTNDSTDPAGRRRQCQAWDVNIQPLGDVSENDEELCTIWSKAKPGILDLPMFTESLSPENERSIVWPIAIKQTFALSLHRLERDESSNGKNSHRYPTVINNTAIVIAHESNLPPKKRHIDVSLEENLSLKKRAIKKRSFACSVEEKLPLKKRALKKRLSDEKIPLKKRRVAVNSIITRESVYADQRSNKALNLYIQPTPSTSMISDNFLRKRTLDYPQDMDDLSLKNVKISKPFDDCGSSVGNVIRSSDSFHFV